MFGATDEVIAVKKLWLIGEDGMIPGWSTECFFNPSLLFGDNRWVIGRCRTYKIDVIVIE